MADTILMKLGIKDYTDKLKTWVKTQIANSSAKVGGLKYDERYQRLYVIGESENGKEGDPIGEGIDMSQFISLGMLSDVQQNEDGTFVFLFKTTDADGNEQIVRHEVDFGKYLNSYVVDGTSIKTKEDGKTIFVNEVDAMKTKLTKNIELLDGPLSVVDARWPWKDDFGKKFIPSGITLEQILEGLFFKERTGSISGPNISWSPSLKDEPKIECNVGNTVLEVGTKVKFTVTPKYTVKDNVRTLTFTCDPGYFFSTGVDENGKLKFGEFNKGNYTVTKTGSESNNQITYTYNDSTVPHSSETEYTIELDDNTFKASQSVKVSVEKFDDITIYASTNTYKADQEYDVIFNNDTDKSDTIENFNSITISGKRARWAGGLKNSISLDGNAIRNSSLTKSLKGDPTTVSVAAGSKQVVFTTLTQISKVTSANQFGGPISFNMKVVSIAGENGYTAVNYYVYSYEPSIAFTKDDTLTIHYK